MMTHVTTSRRTFTAALTLVPVLGVGGQWQAEEMQPVPSVTLTTERRHYLPGQEVPVAVSVGNPTDEPLTLHYRSGQQFDVLVYRQHSDETAELVWQWSWDKFFTQALWDYTLAPGETLAFDVEWAQTDSDGRQVPPGEYALIGRSTSSPGGDSAPVTIRLGPGAGEATKPPDPPPAADST